MSSSEEFIMTKKSFVVRLSRFVFSLVGLGFVLSLTIQNNVACSWDQKLPINESSPISIYTYFVGTYFSIHVFTWFLVFKFLYDSVVDTALASIMPMCNLSYRNERAFLIFVEILYGYWAANEVFAGWCDLERVAECIQNDSEDEHCKSVVIRLFTRVVQSSCERLASEYDSEDDVFIRDPSNICVLAFRHLGHFIMTSLSSTFAFIVV